MGDWNEGTIQSQYGVPTTSPYYRMTPAMWMVLFALDDGATLERRGRAIWLHQANAHSRRVDDHARSLARRGLITLPA